MKMLSTFTLAKSRGFRIATFVGVVLLIVVMSPLVVSAQYLHPKIAKQSTIRNVVILPAKVDIVRASRKRPEGMGEESELLTPPPAHPQAPFLPSIKRTLPI